MLGQNRSNICHFVFNVLVNSGLGVKNYFLLTAMYLKKK